MEASADRATTATTNIEVYSHLRRSDFKLIDWGSTTAGKDQTVIGQDSMGFNLIFYGRLSPDDMIRGGPPFSCATARWAAAIRWIFAWNGDWSDPLRTCRAAKRVVNECDAGPAPYPNCAGVHFYDEPGLSWWKDPKNGNVMVPFNLPPQDRAYKKPRSASTRRTGAT